MSRCEVHCLEQEPCRLCPQPILIGSSRSEMRRMAVQCPDKLVEEIERLRAENAQLRTAASDLHWMARRYADGRQSYATSLFNSLVRTLQRLGVELNPTADGTIWARDAQGRSFDHLSPEEAAMGQPLGEWEKDRDGEKGRLREGLHSCGPDCELAACVNRRLREALEEIWNRTCDGKCWEIARQALADSDSVVREK